MTITGDRRTSTPPAGPPVGSGALRGGADQDDHLGRRGFLRGLGLGVGTVAVVGAAGLTWRSVDGGVFATGTGPAYAAGRAACAAGRAAGTDPMGLVRSAVLAANAHNAQPWLFTVTRRRIDVFADHTRSLGAVDPLLREMDISLGCALENLALAAPPHGFAATVSLLPDPGDTTHVARVDLVTEQRPTSPLFGAVETRHTDRGAYDTSRPVTQQELDELSALLDDPGTDLVWFTGDARRQSFSDLTTRATQAFIADPQQATDDAAWYRSSWRQTQDRKDGITIDPSGKSPLVRALAKMIPVSRAQNNAGWLSGTRDPQLPTAGAFGALVVSDPLDVAQRLRVGRIWQRLHLSATVAGLAVQPLCQIPERIDRERSAGLAPEFTTAMSALLPAGSHPLMTFRMGHPTGTALRSPRRPATDVLKT